MLKLILKCGGKSKDKITYEEFYQLMTKTVYWQHDEKETLFSWKIITLLLISPEVEVTFLHSTVVFLLILVLIF